MKRQETGRFPGVMTAEIVRRRDGDDRALELMAGYGDQRVLLVLDPFREAMTFNPIEAGLAQVKLNEARVPLVIEPAPDRHRLGPEAAVGEADRDESAWAQHPRDLAQHRHGLLQILD